MTTNDDAQSRTNKSRRHDDKPLATTSRHDGVPIGSKSTEMILNSNKSSPTPTISKQQQQPGDSATAIIPLSTRMVLSACAGMGAATFCHPLDVIRVQMQNFHYRNTVHAAVSIYKHAGFANGLYAGISAAFLRQWLYGSFRMGIYSYLLEQQKMKKGGGGSSSSNNISFATKLGMGCISGGIGSFVGTPSEVALVRMSADSKLPLTQQRKYAHVVDCLTRIVREEGVTKLWRGAVPTVARATLLSSCSLGVTSQAKGYLNDSGWFGPNGQWLGGLPMMACATLSSSFCATAVSNPLDVVKSRLQQMPIVANGTPPLYSGMVDCFVKSVRAEGVAVLWAGFTPAFVKLAPYSIIALTLIDKLTKAVTGKEAL